MKETGIIRKIDELGRIVIPKEIRKKLKITSKDYLDIFVDDDKIVLLKYDLYGDLSKLFKLLDSTSEAYKLEIIFCIDNKVIYSKDQDVLQNEIINMEYSGKLDNTDILKVGPFEPFFNKDINKTYYAKKIYVNSVDFGILLFAAKEIKEYVLLFKLIEKFIDNDITIY